jgi:Flp pilus assembly protein TadG
MKRSRRPPFGPEEGAAAVETSLIIGVLLLLVFGSIEFGTAFWTYNTMLLAVEEAGRYAMVTHSHGPSVACEAQRPALHCPVPSDTPLANCSAARAQQVLAAYRVGHVEVSVDQDTTTMPNTVTICASSSFGFIAPNLLPYGPLDLKSQVTVPLI